MCVEALTNLGVAASDAIALRRLARRLHSWYERECSGTVERDPDGRVWGVNPDTGARWRTQDRETGAVRRVNAIMAKYPDLVAYHQTDPRGAPLYILRRADVRPGEELAHVYTRGVAVY